MESQEYFYIKRKILQLTGIDLEGYKCQQMQRRLQAYLTQSGHTSWPLFFRAIQNNPDQISRLRNYLTINVSSFFRDIEKYHYLRQNILPELLHGHPTLQVWSAGCSRGYEPYSLAIMLSEATNFYRSHRITATDIDQGALGWAEAGGPYTADELSHMQPEWQTRYFHNRPDGYWITEPLRRKIRFFEHNLLGDPFRPPDSPAAGYDLIVCRNVVIYFTNEAKTVLYQRFYEALRPGGILFLGSTENIPKAIELGFEITGISFYRKKT